MDKHLTPADVQLNRQIRLEEIRLLHGGTTFSFTASFIIALIIYAVLIDHAASVTNLHIWLATMLSILFIRSIDSYLFSRCTQQEKLNKKWRTRFFIGTGIAGTCWGLLPWLGYTTSVEYFAFIIICQVGVIAGSLATLSYRWETITLFLLPSIILLILRLVTLDHSLSAATSIVLIVFLIFSLSAAKRVFNNTQQNIRLRLEADNREYALGLMHQKQALHLQNTPLAIIEFDTDFRIIEWNKAAERMFGYDRHEALDDNILRLILPRDNTADAEKIWQRLLNYEAVNGTVIKNKNKTGTPIFCEWFITPLTDDKSNIVGIAAMALNITDKKNDELAIIKSKEEAEKANQAKSDFLSSMSHELRTPLNAILGFTQLLKYEKSLTEKQQSHINEISNAGNLLLELVNQILDLARIEQRHLPLSMDKVQLATDFRDCPAMIIPLAQQNNSSLDFTPDITRELIADYTYLNQVALSHLITPL